MSIEIDTLLAKESDEVKECVKRKIPIIAGDHPEWEQEQRVAVAFSMCRKDVNAALSTPLNGVLKRYITMEELTELAAGRWPESLGPKPNLDKPESLKDALIPAWAKSPNLSAPDRKKGCCGG